MHIPYEKMKINWNQTKDSFELALPWVDISLDVEDKEKSWIEEATHNLHEKPELPSVQKFFETLKAYPLSYQRPRTLEAFEKQDLQPCPDTLAKVDFSTPETFIKTIGVPFSPSLEQDAPPQWTWEMEKILDKAKIPGTDLYDPISLITYLICYRLDWESETWSGQDGMGQILEKIRLNDEVRFFKMVGWISRQSHYVTTQFHISVLPALKHFSKARETLEHFINDEVGHFRFMDQTIADLGFKGAQEFSLGDATRWMLDVFEKLGKISPMAFSAMINVFEAAYYEGQDPLSRVIKRSSKPQAAKGYDMHYKINQDHRHCDMPVILGRYCAPQQKDHALLTVHLFEVTLNLLDIMEKRLDKIS